MAGYDGDAVFVLECEVGVYEDEESRDRFGEREGRGEQRPGVRVGVEDDCEEGGRRTLNAC